MNIQELLSGNTDILNNISSKFGLDSAATSKVLENLIPKLGSNLQDNVSKNSEGLKSQLGGLGDLIKNPASFLEGDSAISALSAITSSKDNSRNIAKSVAEDSGVDYGVVKKILPMVAPMVLSHFSKGSDSLLGGVLGSLGGGDKSGGLGSIVGLASKFFKKG
ncbi:MAG: Unknown protein [uncultured Campylobacterales bacterium]|uniref:DUF937 domain-containing protein n=1 Tax=uncultured Campylobacterales bacterium TaxID=352960 RepID=A0A6S6SEZ6_9BACT|nr:MAG: Unknown protein [uncultured Campylobacterales bacterium]